MYQLFDYINLCSYRLCIILLYVLILIILPLKQNLKSPRDIPSLLAASSLVRLISLIYKLKLSKNSSKLYTNFVYPSIQEIVYIKLRT